MLYHTPKNKAALNEIYAVVSIDEHGEGICSMLSEHGAMPMVFGHLETFEKMRPIIEDIVKETGKTLRLVKYTKTEIVEVFK